MLLVTMSAGASERVSLAQRPDPLRRPGGRPMMAALGLSPQQRRQLTALRRDRRFEQTRLQQSLRSGRQSLAELYRMYPLDETRANALIEQIALAESQLLRLQLQTQ